MRVGPGRIEYFKNEICESSPPLIESVRKIPMSLTVWLTGLSGSGKTTLANALKENFLRTGRASYVLDGDSVRKGLCSDLGFSDADRAENTRRVAEVARMMNDAGVIVIAALISPFGLERDLARLTIRESHFVEVYLNTPMEVCESRDPNGLYRKLRLGELKDITEIHSNYEPPDHPSLVLDTSRRSLEDCVRAVDDLVSTLEE